MGVRFSRLAARVGQATLRSCNVVIVRMERHTAVDRGRPPGLRNDPRPASGAQNLLDLALDTVGLDLFRQRQLLDEQAACLIEEPPLAER
jgi:hypothetical protein